MHNTKKITEDLFWIGANDRRIALFENIYPVPKGVSYNSYLLKDEKTVLFDTTDKAVSKQFFENLKYELNGRKLDYLIINHMEPDHCALIDDLTEKYPEVKIICNQKTLQMINQFFDFETEGRVQIIKEGDILNTGRHNITFVMAPMVHWPEAMVTYDTTDKILFSADAFGTFGAINGNIFADETDFEHELMDEARRYYTNIVGKYGTQVQSLLKKASNIEIEMICPLHGQIWRKGLKTFIDKYEKWSSYTPEEYSVLVIFGSIYGNTENAAEILASKLADKGIKNIKILDASSTHPSYIVAEAFKYSHIVIATSTYNAGIYTPVETVLLDLKAHNFQNRTIAYMFNGTWAPFSEAVLRGHLEAFKNSTILENRVKITSTLKNNQEEELDNLANEIAKSMPEEKQDTNPLFKINYGLFLLSVKTDNKDNGCIINTVNQVAENPKLITVSVNKKNYTHDILLKTKAFNVSILTEETPFSVFERFGYHSGKDTDKFNEFQYAEKAENGILRLNKYANSYISAKVVSTLDCGTHTLFTAEIEEAKVISNAPSVSYTYYLENIKPAVKQPEEHIEGYVCKICGYIYKGKEIPKDFICPICKHGVEDFEKLQ